MKLKKIEVQNFKNFDHLEVELGDFNVVIGANASGKSNFVQLFRFLRDINEEGLEQAINRQGGIEYFRNVNLEKNREFHLKVLLGDEEYYHTLQMSKDKVIELMVNETNYEFTLKFREDGSGFSVGKDTLTMKGRFVEFYQKKGETERKELGEGFIVISSSDDGLKIEDFKGPADIDLSSLEDLFLYPFRKMGFLLLERFFPFFFWIEFFRRKTGIYNLSPDLPKKAVPLMQGEKLKEDGENLAFVLSNILKNDEKRRKFFNLITDLLPFIRDIGVERLLDGSWLLKLQETYSSRYFPAILISDGTINILALLIILYFEGKSLVIIEEPERNIHPYLISKVVEMAKDASRNKQIIFTTHNPELVRYAGLENLLLIYRDKRGFSHVVRPAGKEIVKAFLNRGMGLDELYVENLLEAL